MHERHPELVGLSDDCIRVDVICGRDGVSRLRVWG